jgi:ABC-type sugar transport system permease subunit
MTLLAVAAGLGALFAIGSVLAAMFEVQGFGRPPSDPRPLYLASLALAFFASIAVPVLLARWLLPQRGGPVGTVLLAVGAVGAVALLGLSLR